jgi:hypothetical protein
MLELHPDPMTIQALRYERGTSKGHGRPTATPSIESGRPSPQPPTTGQYAFDEHELHQPGHPSPGFALARQTTLVKQKSRRLSKDSQAERARRDLEREESAIERAMERLFSSWSNAEEIISRRAGTARPSITSIVSSTRTSEHERDPAIRPLHDSQMDAVFELALKEAGGDMDGAMAMLEDEDKMTELIAHIA